MVRVAKCAAVVTGLGIACAKLALGEGLRKIGALHLSSLHGRSFISQFGAQNRIAEQVRLEQAGRGGSTVFKEIAFGGDRAKLCPLVPRRR